MYFYLKKNSIAMQLSKKVFILQIAEGRFQGKKKLYTFNRNGIYLLIFMKILYYINKNKVYK